MHRLLTWGALVAGCWVLAGTVSDGRAKVQVQFKDTVDFSKIRTWAWNPNGAGNVRLARSADDDPEVVRQRAEPVIFDEVPALFAKRGLTQATSSPDATLTYYLLITIGTQTQYMGQFLPAVAEWGLPPIVGATQSFNVIEQGSLVLDMSVDGSVVWRAVVQADLKPGQEVNKRRDLLRKALADLIAKYPPKGKSK